MCRWSWFTGFTCNLKPKQNQKYSVPGSSSRRATRCGACRTLRSTENQKDRLAAGGLGRLSPDGHWLVTWCSEDQLRLRPRRRFTVVPSGPPEDMMTSQGGWPATFRVQMSSFHPVREGFCDFTMWHFHYRFIRKWFNKLINYWNWKKKSSIYIQSWMMNMWSNRTVGFWSPMMPCTNVTSDNVLDHDWTWNWNFKNTFIRKCFCYNKF